MYAPVFDTVETVTLSPALVVEDDPAMQLRLRRVLASVGCDATQVEVAESVAHAKARLAVRHFGIVLVDIGLPDGSGVDLIGWLHAHHAEVPAVVISAWRTEEVILAALRAGAIGYLLKERDDAELAAGLRSIERGGAPIDPAIARRILALLMTTPPAAAPAPPLRTLEPPSHAAAGRLAVPLSKREHSVLELVAKGLSNREMAENLSISILTVECHTRNIYRKLAVGSRTEAVFAARRQGLLH